MEQFEINERNKVKRVPKRGHYDKETVYKILDAAFIAHMGFVVNGQPFVIPTAYGRKDDTIYIHGATTSRMLLALQEGIPVCVTVSLIDGIVLARSLFHHSVNYRSVVVYGTAKELEGEAANEGLRIITDNILKGRWEEAREPNAKESKATKILAIKIDQASAKIRDAGVKDDKEDYKLPIWAGVVPIHTTYGTPITDLEVPEHIGVTEIVAKIENTNVHDYK